MKATNVLLLTLAGCLCWGMASADTLRPSSGHGHITRINKGVAELGIDNALLVRRLSDTRPDETKVSTLYAAFVGGPTFRYFFMDNLSFAVNVNFTAAHNSTTNVAKDGTETDASHNEFGVLGTVMLDYYIRLGRNMFFKPGIGGGGYYASVHNPDPDPTKTNIVHKTSKSGGAARLQVGFVYYTSTRFNLKAGVDLLMAFGSRTIEGSEDKVSEMNIDAVWNVGFAYVF